MRKLAIFSASFSFGVFLAQYLLPFSWQLAAAFLCLGLGTLTMTFPWEIRRRTVVIGSAMALGLGWNWLYTRQVQRPMEALVNTKIHVVMTLCDYATSSNGGAKVTVKLNNFTYGKAVYYGGLDLLSLQPGQTVTDTVYLYSAAKVRDDDTAVFTSKNVFLLAYQEGAATYGDGTKTSPRWWPVRLGKAIKGTISALFQDDDAGFLQAILTGDRSGLSEESAINLSEAGIFHIFAVSGMHCGFLLAMVTLLAGKHRQKLIALGAIPLLIFYAALTGGSPSVIRACVMLSLLVSAPLFGRDSDGFTSLAAALFFILLKNPFAAKSVSLQLSFAAVTGIFWLTPKLQRRLLNGKKRIIFIRYLMTSFSVTMGALIFTVPLSVCYFGALVLITPVSNLLCLWAASFVFLLGLAAVLVRFVCPPLGELISIVPKILIWYVLKTAKLLAAVPYHAVYSFNPYLKFWLIYVYILFALLYWSGERRSRKYAVGVVTAIGTLILTVKLGELRYHADLNAIVLDVGQGQSVLLSSNGQFALVDCGSANGWYDPGETAAFQLQSMGCHRLDCLALTHYDADHVSGVTGLLARMPVDTLLVPDGMSDAVLKNTVLEAAEVHGITVEYIKDKQEITLGHARITVYPPLGSKESNEEGLAFLVSTAGQDILITGDMNSDTERVLVKQYNLSDIEALVVSHHGSKYSTCNELLDAVRPETACISVGSNSYGHPAEETIERLAKHGCAVYRTDLQGSLYLSFDDEGGHHGIYEENTQK